MSSCHWIQGDEADCTWVPPTEPPPGPGCCTICASQDVNGPWLETCTNYWNEEDCLTPVDGDGVKRCSWTPTAEDVDCTILWPTEGPADSWWTTAEPAQQNLLFGFGADSKMTEAMNTRVSLSSALLMLIAALVMYKVYQWKFTGKDKKYEGYQPLSDQKSSVSSHNGYHSISA